METLSFSIKSTSTDKTLRFFGVDEHTFSVELKGREIYAVREVYCPLGTADFPGFFARLARYERPWQGDEKCASLESDFSISARCSALGIVTFSVVIHNLFGGPEEWQLTSDMTSELGQLQAIASAANRFFGVPAGT